MQLPGEFIYLEEIDDSIDFDIKYAGSDNLIGRPIDGYEANRCILTKSLAEALSPVQQELRADSLGLVVYDTYRPRRAVEDMHDIHSNRSAMTKISCH